MSSPESISWNLEEVKVDLMQASRACRNRGLNHGAKWTAELNFSLKSIKIDGSIVSAVQQPPDVHGKSRKQRYRNGFLASKTQISRVSLNEVSLYLTPVFPSYPQRKITTIT